MFESQEQHAINGYKAAHASLGELIQIVKEATPSEFCCIECNGSKEDIWKWTILIRRIETYVEDLTVFCGWNTEEILGLIKE